MITPQIFALTAFLTVTWGINMVIAASEYRIARATPDRRRADVVRALRRCVASICLFMLPFSFMIRTALVLAGFGNDVIGMVVFFALAGTNVVGSLFVMISLRYD
jgi:uncharacterized membrane protein